jgi:hypothetical protein
MNKSAGKSYYNGFVVIGLMKSWFCIWDDLLRLFAIARVANPKVGLNLFPNPL